MKVLAADIGGTKTLLQIAEVRDRRHTILHQQKFASQDFQDFDILLKKFLDHAPADARRDINHACFGVAGPVTGPERGQRLAKITNLPWQMDSLALQSAHHIEQVFLINDFHAIAAGIDALGADDVVSLHAAPVQQHAPRLVVGAGTGLGVAQLIWAQGRYRVLDSEGGHTHFAPTSALQIELLVSLQQELGRVSYERLVSGPGLVRIYRFLNQRQPSSNTLFEDVIGSADPAAAIAARAQEGDALALEAINLFLSIYGAVTGDLALVTLAYGGIYIAGGIAPKLLRAFSMDAFLSAHFQKGRMAALINNMPLFVILHPQVGLLGAALYAAQKP